MEKCEDVCVQRKAPDGKKERQGIQQGRCAKIRNKEDIEIRQIDDVDLHASGCKDETQIDDKIPTIENTRTRDETINSLLKAETPAQLPFKATTPTRGDVGRDDPMFVSVDEIPKKVAQVN